MMNFWNNLAPRERRLLGGGGVALALLLLYALAVDPYFAAMERLRQEVVVQRETLAWMQQAAAEAKALRGRAPTRAATNGQSLLALADSTAKASGLGTALKRVQPDGQRSVRVWLEQAAFDAVMRWLDTLGRSHGVQVSGLVVEPLPDAGRVDARVVLETSE